MGTVGERKVAAVVGSAVADAAAQPLHWIYDLTKLDSLLEGHEELEFFTPSANPFYCIETGSQTCYGDQAFVLLQSLHGSKGFNVEDFTKRTYKFFGPGSEYDSDAVSKYTWKGELKTTYPVKNPWKHFSIKEFQKNVDEGKKETGAEKDEQIDCAAKIAPLVALYAGRPEMLERAEDAIRTTQNADFTVAIGLAAARLIEQYILHGDEGDALQRVIDDLRAPNRRNPTDLDSAVAGFLREVQSNQTTPHREVVNKVFRND